MDTGLTRRGVLAGGGALAAALAAPAAARTGRGDRAFRYSLNTSTIRGQKLTLLETIDLAATAGYDAIEPWISEIDAHVKGGGSLKELERRIRDRGLKVESAIGFFDWIVDDPARRSRGLEEARRNMELLRQIGGKRLAAPPTGATDRADIDPVQAAERYRALLELGDQFGVVPQAEVWGFSRTLGRLGAAVDVALQSGHPKACVLPDVYHLYKGGSGFGGVPLLSARMVHTFHVNDYPADPPRAAITDAQRVFPGEGVAPLVQLFRDLHAIGYDGVLSLELFNQSYYRMDALTVARTGLEKTRALVRQALAG